jgi:hypothetical protein
MEQTYRIWMRNPDATIERTYRSDYGGLTAKRAQSLCNTLNAHKKKHYPDLMEAGFEFFAWPEDGTSPKDPPRNQVEWGVYNGTGHLILRSTNLQDVVRLANSHDDNTWQEIK